jgi:hypothetical protein
MLVFNEVSRGVCPMRPFRSLTVVVFALISGNLANGQVYMLDDARGTVTPIASYGPGFQTPIATNATTNLINRSGQLAIEDGLLRLDSFTLLAGPTARNDISRVRKFSANGTLSDQEVVVLVELDGFKIDLGGPVNLGTVPEYGGVIQGQIQASDMAVEPFTGTYTIASGDESVSGQFAFATPSVTIQPSLLEQYYPDVDEVLISSKHSFSVSDPSSLIYQGVVNDVAFTVDLHIGFSIPDLPFELAGPNAMVGIPAGDANKDGIFNSADLVQVLAAGKYETGEVADWVTGDWNLDSLFNTSDLVFALQEGNYTPDSSPAAVPEPCHVALLTGLLPLLSIRPRNHVPANNPAASAN